MSVIVVAIVMLLFNVVFCIDNQGSVVMIFESNPNTKSIVLKKSQACPMDVKNHNAIYCRSVISFTPLLVVPHLCLFWQGVGLSLEQQVRRSISHHLRLSDVATFDTSFSVI